MRRTSAGYPPAGRSGFRREGLRPGRASLPGVTALLSILLCAGVGPGPATAEVPPELSEAARLLEERELEPAVALLREFVESRPSDTRARLMLGSALAMVPLRGEAIDVLLQALEMSPDDGDAHHSAGMAFARLGEGDAAEQAFRRAVLLDPDHGEAHLHLALVLAGRAELGAASRHMTRAIEIETDGERLARLHFLNGKLLIERGRIESAAAALETAARIGPGRGEVHLALGQVRRGMLEDEQAYREFLKAVQLSPEDPLAHYHVGLEVQRRGEPARAVEHFLRADRLRPGDQSILYNLTRALHQAGRPAEARRYRRELAELIRLGDQARENELATARLHGEAVRLQQAGDHRAALEKYRAVLEVEPLNPTARHNLALVLCALGRWSEGIAELREILREHPDNLEVTRALAAVLDQARRAGAVAAGPVP